MSALAERAGKAMVCPHCGVRLAPDQDWCLECGAALTARIRPAPDWRVPVAIVGGVVALALAGFVLALIALSNSADRSVPAAPAPGAAATTPAPPATTTPATTAATTTPAGTKIASWPSGVTGFTAVLGVIPGKAAATASATRLVATGIPVGLLYSSGYSSMRPGDWIVFSGTYKTQALAAAAAAELKAKGQTGAYAFPVVPAG